MEYSMEQGLKKYLEQLSVDELKRAWRYYSQKNDVSEYEYEINLILQLLKERGFDSLTGEGGKR